jgi:hypothetical protein
MKKDRHENDAERGDEDRAFHPRGPEHRDGDRLRWAQVIASAIDAGARIVELIVQFIH